VEYQTGNGRQSPKNTAFGQRIREDGLAANRVERWLGESEQSDKWFPCLIAALVPRSRREDVETVTAQP
jgi:hypothetical protein